LCFQGRLKEFLYIQQVRNYDDEEKHEKLVPRPKTIIQEPESSLEKTSVKIEPLKPSFQHIIQEPADRTEETEKNNEPIQPNVKLTGPFVIRIDKLQVTGGAQVINLSAVRIYFRGERIPISHLQQSTFKDGSDAKACVDSSFDTICHSDQQQSDPSLTIVSISEFDKIVVINREDCCQERIVGASITATANDSKIELIRDTFVAAYKQYTFYSQYAAEKNIFKPDPNGPFAVHIVLKVQNPLISIGEIQLFFRGKRVPEHALEAEFGGGISARSCIDATYATVCAFPKDSNPQELKISSSVEFNKVIILHATGVDGASITATAENGAKKLFQSVFEGERRKHTFYSDFESPNRFNDDRVCPECWNFVRGQTAQTTTVMKEDQFDTNNRKLFIAIPSMVGDYHKDLRNTARSTWLLDSKLFSIGVTHRFFCEDLIEGEADVIHLTDLQKKMQEKNDPGEAPHFKYKDLFWIEFNLSMMRWFLRNSPAEYYLRLDNDGILCVENLLHQISLLPSMSYIVLGNARENKGACKPDEAFVLMSIGAVNFIQRTYQEYWREDASDLDWKIFDTTFYHTVWVFDDFGLKLNMYHTIATGIMQGPWTYAGQLERGVKLCEANLFMHKLKKKEEILELYAAAYDDQLHVRGNNFTQVFGECHPCRGSSVHDPRDCSHYLRDRFPGYSPEELNR